MAKAESLLRLWLPSREHTLSLLLPTPLDTLFSQEEEPFFRKERL